MICAYFSNCELGQRMGLPSIQFTYFFQDGESLKGKYWGRLGHGAKVKHRTALGRKGVVLITSPPPPYQTHRVPGRPGIRVSCLLHHSSCLGVHRCCLWATLSPQSPAASFPRFPLPASAPCYSEHGLSTAPRHSQSSWSKPAPAVALSRVGANTDSIPATS